MSTECFIALDVHCTTTDMAVLTRRGRLTERRRCPTAIPPLVEAIRDIRRPRYVTFEEGPLADWLLRNLSPHADEVLVCEPRRNHLIAKDSDTDDPIDAEKLAHLYRGGYLKQVHHSETLERVICKQHVAAYHEAVGLRVAQRSKGVGSLKLGRLPVKRKASIKTPDPFTSYVGKVAEPKRGWTALFVELTYDTGSELPLKVTTGVRVVPDRLPFADKIPPGTDRHAGRASE